MDFFFLTFGQYYKERVSNYLLITLYLLVFLSLFYVYDLILKNTLSWKKQLFWCIGFILLLCGIRYFMQSLRLPPTVYRLPIFDEYLSKEIVISSIGDLILTTFCIFQLVYITLSNIKINYESKKFRRYRYLIASVLLFVTFLYIDFFNFSIDLVVENMDIHLNVAQLIHVGLASLLAVYSNKFGGIGDFGIALRNCGGAAACYVFCECGKTVTVVCLGLWLVSAVFGYTRTSGIAFLFGLSLF